MADDDYDYDYDYDYDDDQIDIKKMGKQDFERINFSSDDQFVYKHPSTLSGEEKFEYILSKQVLLLGLDKNLVIQVIQAMKDVSHIKYKNPLASLFGYRVIKDKKIDINRVKECIELCKQTLKSANITASKKDDKKEEKDDDLKVYDKKYGPIKHITEADIIRYARLIIQTL